MQKLTFAQACAMVYEKEMQKTFDREIEEDAFLNQSAFEDCSARAKAGCYAAEKRVNNFVAYAILRSREEEYKESRDLEKALLLSVMLDEDVDLVETNAWWNQ